MHVADKDKAFKILTMLLKPGGYLIFSERNTAGGIQEMLQRLIIYKSSASTDEAIINVAEELFSYDITRSQKASGMSRKTIIFDRWVIQQQDDPSLKEIFSMFSNQGLKYINSWPKVDFPGRGSSTNSDPRIWENLINGARITETLWMMLNKGDKENIESFFSGSNYEKIIVFLSLKIL